MVVKNKRSIKNGLSLRNAVDNIESSKTFVGGFPYQLQQI